MVEDNSTFLLFILIKGYKKNKDYKIYSDENIIENMAEFYGYNNNYVRNIKIIKNDIVSLSSNYTDKDGVAYYLGLTVSSYNEKLKKKMIKIKNAVKKFMFYKFQYNILYLKKIFVHLLLQLYFLL